MLVHSAPRGMEACLFRGSVITEKKSFLCLWYPVGTCTDRRYWRGCSAATPSYSAVRPPPGASRRRQMGAAVMSVGELMTGTPRGLRVLVPNDSPLGTVSFYPS